MTAFAGGEQPQRHLLGCGTRMQLVGVDLHLTEREANDLYNNIYRLDCDVPGARDNYPLIHSVYDTLHEAGVDGTR